MPWNTNSTGGASPRIFAWPLELEVELCTTGRCEVTAEELRSLARLLNGAEGVWQATAEAHAEANLVQVCLTVDARDPHDALDHVSALVRDAVSRVGLGPAILVAARSGARKPVAGRRMG